jgi:hypothetical protein
MANESWRTYSLSPLALKGRTGGAIWVIRSILGGSGFWGSWPHILDTKK